MARIAENSVIQDGIMYKPGQEIPDLGKANNVLDEVEKIANKVVSQYTGIRTVRPTLMIAFASAATFISVFLLQLVSAHASGTL